MSETELLKRMLAREKRARKEAEALMEQKSRELYEVNNGLRQLTEELTEARNLAAKANEAKSAFLANISHELRTPLNAIIGYSDILAEDAELAGRQSELADLLKIRSAGKHLLTLINDVLDLSKIEAGKMEVFFETFEITAIVQEVVNTIAPLIEKNANRLNVECAEDVGVIRADMAKLRQTLFNLLSNASKFTSNGKITLAVTRDATDGIDWVRFRVADSGIGMSVEQMLKLFQSFSQADSSTSKRFGGTGLGLALSRNFCQLMGGDITVDSAVGVGSSFTVHLPADGAAPTPEPMVQDGRAAVAEAPDPKGKPIALVIDDDRTARELMRRLFDQQGLQMVGAADGAEGLRLAKEIKPSLIFLDVIMPSMDGWQVLSALKATPELASIPVIMATAVQDENKGLAMGAMHYLNKPINRQHLAEIIEKHRSMAASGHCAVLFS
jgi:signal transduction histidine kinase/CheY-like chemotaxis protein